jgi:LPS sulfotransferase NodH
MIQLALDPLSEACDVHHPAGTRPAVSYVVCSTPRSGSTLLSEGLWATGRMGIPVEYFNTVHRDTLSARWGSGRLQTYFADLLERRTDRSGAFSTKVHWAQLVDFHQLYQQELGEPFPQNSSAEEAHQARYRFLAATHPNPRFIHIVRLNRVRQAVSWYVAAHTGNWGFREGEPRPDMQDPPLYSLDEVLAYMVALGAAEASWQEFFRVNDIRPVTVVYEDLEIAFAETMTALMGELGLEPFDFPRPRLRKQADETTEPLVQLAMRDLGHIAARL